MPRIVIEDVRAWVESSKLNPQALDLEHLDQLETEILSMLGTIYDVTGWTDNTNTPRLVQVIIAKTYTGWLYDKAYSENQTESNQYAQKLQDNADTLMAGILDGVIEIPGVSALSPQVAAFYPNDASSSINPDTGYFDPTRSYVISSPDTSVGPAKFSIGKVF